MKHFGRQATLQRTCRPQLDVLRSVSGDDVREARRRPSRGRSQGSSTGRSFSNGASTPSSDRQARLQTRPSEGTMTRDHSHEDLQRQRTAGPGSSFSSKAGAGERRAGAVVSAAERKSVLSTVRAETIRLLMRVEYGGAYASAAMGRPRQEQGDQDEEAEQEEEVFEEYEEATRQSGPHRVATLDDRDKRLLKELVSGVIRWRRRLDYSIAELSQTDDLEPVLVQILRLGFYELMFCDLQPHVLNEHVQLSKVLVRPGAGAFTNGILRAAARARDSNTMPDPEVDMASASGRRGLLRKMALTHSHPNWMVSRWLTRWGEDSTRALLQHNNRRPVHSLRANPAAGMTAAKLLEQLQGLEGVEASLSPYLPKEFVRVQSGLQAIIRAGILARGLCSVQDEATGLVVEMLGPQPGERILDACAAPGGKTMFMAGRLEGKGKVVAVDVSRARLATVQTAAQRMQLEDMVECHAGDLRQLAAGAPASASLSAATGGSASPAPSSSPLGAPFDKVLLDAPCSGTGVLAKRADLRWRRTLEEVQELAKLQGELLSAAARLVRPGGLLVYSTCCLEEEENESQVAAFLKSEVGQEFDVELPAEGSVPVQVVTKEGYLLTLPHEHDTDGAFAVRLRRKAS